jgi:REP element-mobilizing transposase RayT
LNIDVSAARYFITICAEGHAPWVGSRVPRDREVDATNFAAISDMIVSAARWYHEHHKWRLVLFLVMPDHLHFIAHFPGECGGHARRVTLPGECGHARRVTLPMVSTIQQFKSYLNRIHGIRFQRDFFDTRIRDDAHFAEKYNYILDNPVRKGLCETAQDWPHVIKFSGEENGNLMKSNVMTNIEGLRS